MSAKDTPAKLSAAHFASLRPGSTVVFSTRQAVWKVAKVVERGAVMYRPEDSSHQYLTGAGLGGFVAGTTVVAACNLQLLDLLGFRLHRNPSRAISSV